MRKVNYLFALIFVALNALGQDHRDHISPLVTNPVLVKLANQNALNRITPPPPFPIKVLKLPFLDDFSKPNAFPDTAKWINGGVYTNYTYPICPHTLGVATFDGVNAYGQPYNPSAGASQSLPADTLTSQYIDMGSYAPIDSLYFSFYWQAGGLGSYPKLNDSLILEFSNGRTWNEVWYQLGYQPLPPDTGFHYVLIPITSSQYFLNSFQFRFRSYACTAGNLDHWNVDEVYLNELRSATDTAQQDVSFVYESPSLLNTYEAVPWEQFTCSDVKTDSLFIAERNNYTSPTNTTFSYNITTPTNTAYSGGSSNFPPFYTSGYNPDHAQSNPPVDLICPTLSGPTAWNITYLLTSSPDFDKWNDTLRYAQIFSNYYAYDDGTAEANYSVIPFNSTPVELCEQYTLNKTDTLLGVQIFFNYVLANATGYIFRLAVWGDSNGQPTNNPLYEDDSLYDPAYTTLDEFSYFRFLRPPTLSGTIYVGFVQTSGDSINVGYDFNTNSMYQIFYNVGAGWNYSDFPGSLMMRPVFGNKLYNGTNEVSNPERSEIALYPNPAKDEVSLSEAMSPNTTLRIYSSDGRLCYENLNFSGNLINTSELPVGFYIVQLQQKNANIQFKKLLISR